MHNAANSVAPQRRDITRIAKELNAASHQEPDKKRSLQLARAADLLTEALACDLYRLR
jgi:hypothetical protein